MITTLNRLNPLPCALTIGLIIAATLPGSHFRGKELSSERRPATVDDLLRQADWGQALIDPTGRFVVFEQTPAYDQLPDYSLPWSSRYPLPNFGLIMVLDLQGEATPRRLFEPVPDTLYRIQSFSPDGKCLALYGAKEGEISLVIYDIPNRRLTSFNQTPELNFQDMTVVWISSQEVVYSALADNRQPFLSLRRYTGSQLSKAWKKTWEGKHPSATVVTSNAQGEGRSVREGWLIRANALNGTVVRLAEGRFIDLRLSPGGRFLAALRESENIQPLPDKPFSGDIIAPHRRLVVFDLHTGNNHFVSPDFEVPVGSMDWSPSGDMLAFFAWKSSPGHQQGLYSYAARSGRIQDWPLNGFSLAQRRVVWFKGRLAVVIQADEKKSRLTDPTFATPSGDDSINIDWFLIDPDGGGQNLTAEFDRVSPIPISVTSKNFCVLADGNVWSIDVNGKKTNLTPGKILAPANSTAAQINDTDNTILLGTGVQKGQYVLLDLTEEARILTLQAPSAGANLMAASVRTGVALFREKTYEDTKLLLVRAAGKTREVSRLNQYLREVARPEWKMISYRFRDRELKSGMLLPYNYVPRKRYPVVVDIYPGRPPSPRLGIAAYLSFDAHELLAAKGYIVFYVDNPADLNRTKEGPLAGMTEVVLAGIEALIEQGYADPSRIGLMGFSQGGFASLWLTTQTDRFRAILSINGWADMASHYLEGGVRRTFYFDYLPFHGTSSYYDNVGGSAVGLAQTPWQRPELYFKNSPVFNAHRIKTPILLIHTDMDMFSLNQYEEMFTALYRLRKDAKFVRYWGEGHGPSSPANIRDLWRRVFAWFDEYLDISRDAKGNLVWSGSEVRSRHGAPPLKPQDFALIDKMILKNQR